MESKKCSKCCELKKYSEFHKQKTRKDGYRSQCKSCVKSVSLKYYEDNNNKILENKKEYYFKNSEQIILKRKEYVNDNIEETKLSSYKSYHKNKEKYRVKQKQYRDNNKEKIRKTQNEIAKRKYLTEPTYKIKNRIKNIIYYALKKNNFRKKNRTHEILGCTYEQFKQHLESQFLPWMNWENYGKYNGTEGYGWDIDHITPLATAKTEADVIRLNHYTNLRPLCSKVNRFVKKDKLDF